MKKHIQNIELINQYFNSELTNHEQEVFSQRLTIDNEFKVLIDEQSLFLEGIKRYVLKYEIKNAHRTYKRNKFFKALGVALLVISLIITLFSLINTKSDTITTDKTIKEVFSTSSSNTSKKATITETTIKVIAPNIKTIESTTDTPEQKLTSEVFIVPNNQKKTTEIKQLYSNLKKQAEVFQINTAKDTVITCKEGTVLKIKAHSFIDSKTNQFIKGKLQLKVTEYYKLPDIIKANLTTLANDAILETGGMLFIEASQNTNICKLSSKNTLQIGFPYKQYKNKMQLFTGEKNQKLVNWKLINNEQISLSSLTPTELVVNLFIPVKQVDSIVSFDLDSFKIGLNYDNTLPNDSIITRNIEERLIAPDSLLKTPDSNSSPSITKRDITHYLFNASKLGWINCDRFINSKKIKIKFKVKVGKGTDIDVKMIFKNFKAVLPGKLENENYTFKKVPINEPVIIYAIKYENGQYYMALHDTTVSNKNI